MKNVLKYLIEQSLDCLYANDKDLLERKVAERAEFNLQMQQNSD